ncbi:LacI family DNA-binding transcriptional regulator [Alginatibacterium sediminis]|uniref:LacI family DNA-binding transcriptional regulator n=1 Tax=Alginatibacterium sediminis TaxID=2164068 RepID=A0A420ED56_9ALTE|nr:LacI family DNA-binding transcriptional regulator [Alginatibacterium sediminis]RKF18637.1 LacI family DNA-binding transcriptional regulator [Alginatibacterium sediminis]
MATIKDVSQLANVSISTVSRVINDTAQVAPEKREAVLKAMEELSYRPNSFAQALVSKRSDCIGLVVGDLGGGPFFMQMMKGIEEVVDGANKYTMVMTGHHEADKERHAIDILLQRQCDALIVHAMAMTDDELCEIASGDTPFVFINRLVPGFEDRCVFIDNQEGARVAVAYLIEQGHSNIAMISSDDLDFVDAIEREKGYRQALEEAGIVFDPSLIFRAFPNELGGSFAGQHLLEQRPDVTAAFGFNDSMIAGALSTFRDFKVSSPEQIAVVGFDDNHYAKFTFPRLTTIRYPIEEMGGRAAQQALDLFALKNTDESVSTDGLCFKPELIKRESA